MCFVICLCYNFYTMLWFRILINFVDFYCLFYCYLFPEQGQRRKWWLCRHIVCVELYLVLTRDAFSHYFTMLLYLLLCALERVWCPKCGNVYVVYVSLHESMIEGNCHLKHKRNMWDMSRTHGMSRAHDVSHQLAY